MEPPVSVPTEKAHKSAATLAAEPPEEPPGTRLLSQGFLTGPKAEFSLEAPMANSSQLVLPKIITPSSFKNLTTLASYGA